jgi:predicted HTH transcriptional regulator
MTPDQLSALLRELTALPDETEWVEFKQNVTDPEMIGQRISGLANSAAILGKPAGYQVLGVGDGTHEPVGTAFRPQRAKVGGEALVNWLIRLLTPQVDFRFHEWPHEGKPTVLLEVPAAAHQPVAFQGREFVRIASHTKPLKEHCCGPCSRKPPSRGASPRRTSPGTRCCRGSTSPRASTC